MYSFNFGSTISFYPSSSSLSNDGKYVFGFLFFLFLFSLFSRGVRFCDLVGDFIRREAIDRWGAQKKDAWRKSKPITIDVCFVFDIEDGEGLWGEGRKRIHPLDIISFVSLYSFADHRFLQLSLIP